MARWYESGTLQVDAHFAPFLLFHTSTKYNIYWKQVEFLHHLRFFLIGIIKHVEMRGDLPAMVDKRC